MSQFLYLASQSPRRAQLLEQLGVKYKLLLPDAQEDAESLEQRRGNESPRTYVKRVTGLKLDAALARRKRLGLPAAAILCADTTVALGQEILGKPTSPRDAQRMLAALAAKTHRVLTAVALQRGNTRLTALSISSVRFAPMTRQQIHAYVCTGEPMGKAGAYAIQGAAAQYVSHISGSYSGIMGLPLYETAALLAQL